MKKIVVLTLLLVLLCPDVFAVEPKVKKNRFFDAIKEYASKDLALNDVLEFSYFDMGETSLINDTTDEGLSPPTQDLDSENTDEAVAVPPTDVLSSQQEIKKAIDQLPKLFYVSLKNHIERQRVPVNLYSGEGPGYTNPLKLYIK
ncbi:MAG TPA: hypothetical protein VJC18_08795, partial [bacterium]|nr:hypothetical protein [bacterium]